MAQEEFKIRVLPRKNEPRRETGGHATKRGLPKSIKLPLFNRQSLIFVVIVFLLSLGFALLLRPTSESHDMSSQKIVRDPTAVKINRLVEDVKVKEDFLRQQRLLENLKSKDTGAGDVDPTATAPEQARSFGVQLDSENTADQMYSQLNERPVVTNDNTPDSRINAMLEKNKWLNQQEREERRQYVRNFIKTAYDRGYEVELDQNLQVMGVRPITNRRISLDQAIEKATRQGP